MFCFGFGFANRVCNTHNDLYLGGMDGDKAGWTGAGRLGTARGSAKPSFLTRLDNSYKFPTDAFRSVWLTPHLAIFRISNSHRKAPGAKPSFSLRLVPFSSSRRMLSGRCGSPPASRFSEIRIHNVRRRIANPCFSLRLVQFWLFPTNAFRLVWLTSPPCDFCKFENRSNS